MPSFVLCYGAGNVQRTGSATVQTCTVHATEWRDEPSCAWQLKERSTGKMMLAKSMAIRRQLAGRSLLRLRLRRAARRMGLQV